MTVPAGSARTPPATAPPSTDGSTRAISSTRIGEALDRACTAGSSTAEPRTRRPGRRWSRPSCPDLGNGPHFFYGLQWWFFGVLAVFGFGYLAYDERRSSAPTQAAATRLRTRASAVDRHHRAVDERRRRREQEAADPPELLGPP